MRAPPSTRAVVFAYHDVGVRCLKVLLANNVEVPLVITHRDDPGEAIWFDSVARVAEEHDLPCVAPDDVNVPEVLARVRAAAPDLLFSFYFRRVLGPALLEVPRLGAYNMHGSLLPAYRGRAPVNWAIIGGETKTGATLHAMRERADTGPICDQQAVPILPDDTALDVFRKVTCAAELTLHRCLPRLIAGTCESRPQDLRRGGYFHGRRPEDGRIDWREGARRIHDLVRGVAPPFPGALTEMLGAPTRILRTRVAVDHVARSAEPALYVEDGRAYIDCADGGVLRVLELEVDGERLSPDALAARHGAGPHRLPRAPGPLGGTCGGS